LRDADSSAVIGFILDDAAAAGRLKVYTSGHIGQTMLLVVDKRVTVPQPITTPFGERGLIRGLTPSEAHVLLIQINSGPLPMPVKIVATAALTEAELCP
jgi:preprotein translocase subunit SecD